MIAEALYDNTKTKRRKAIAIVLCTTTWKEGKSGKTMFIHSPAFVSVVQHESKANNPQEYEQ